MPGPTSTTLPAPSWPNTTGKSPSGSPPERVNSSVWQTPDALISTSTSPVLGPARSSVTTSSGWPAFQPMAARVFILRSPLPVSGRWYRVGTGVGHFGAVAVRLSLEDGGALVGRRRALAQAREEFTPNPERSARQV